MAINYIKLWHCIFQAEGKYFNLYFTLSSGANLMMMSYQDVQSKKPLTIILVVTMMT